MYQGCYGVKGTLVHCWCSHHETQYGRSSEKFRIELPYAPTISILGIYPKETKTLAWKNICIPMFSTVLFINMIAKTWKLPQCPLVYEWIKKMWSGCIPRSLTVKSLATGPPPCIRDRVPPPTTQDGILFHQWWVNQFILPPVFNHFFQYHFMLVQTLQEAGAKTRRETQENMRVEGASVREKGEWARGGREGCQTMPVWPHEVGRRRRSVR